MGGEAHTLGSQPVAARFWRVQFNALTGKAQVVQIEPTDTAFKTNGCQPWQLTDAPPPGQTPPWLSAIQLRHYLDVLNGLAGQSGNGQLPPS